MRRFAVPVLAVAVMAVSAVVMRWPIASAQEATPEASAGHPLVGAWRIVPDPPGPPLVLIVYHADGTLTYSVPISSPAPPDAPFAVVFDTPAYGVWESTGPRSAMLTAYAIETDEAGTFLGTLAFHGTVEVDETLDAYTFAGVVEPADPSGAVVGTFPVSTRATRITVDRVRAAGATPAAGTPAP